MEIDGIGMIVSDLDGTLLGRDGTPSPRTLDALLRLREGGVRIVAATARPWRATRAIVSALPFDAAICHNGAAIYVDGEKIAEFGIPRPKELIRRILSRHPLCPLAAEADEVLYANFDCGRVWPGIEYVLTRDFRELPGADADKLLIEAHSEEEIAPYAPLLPDDTYMQLSEGRVAMIVNRRATKLHGVRALAERCGLSLGQIAAFGDDLNDIEMLRACGIGVAVENALPSVRGAADFVCGPCEAEGVAEWLSRMFPLAASLDAHPKRRFPAVD